MEENKIHNEFENRMKPILEIYANRLFEEMEKSGLIDKIKDEANIQDIYTKKSTHTHEQIASDFSINTNSKKVLQEFRMTVLSVYNGLFDKSLNSSDKSKITECVSRLVELGALKVDWLNNYKVIEILNNDYDDEIPTEQILKDNKVNLNLMSTQLYEFYGVRKCSNFFELFGYSGIPNRISHLKPDLVLHNDEDQSDDLICEVKYRKKSILPNRDLLLKVNEYFLNLERAANPIPYYLLIVFTDQLITSFDKAKFQFRMLLEDLSVSTEFSEKIVFIPVPNINLQHLELELQSFADSKIAEIIKYTFKSKDAPKEFPDRNDHFLNKPINFKNSLIEILIHPNEHSKFWRLGFNFSKFSEYPSVSASRHPVGNRNVHIVVGDLKQTDKEERVWVNSNQLGLAVYPENDNPIGIDSYLGEDVRLILESNNDGSRTSFKIIINHLIIAEKLIDLSSENWCFIHAWCDYSSFSLDTKITIKHNLKS